jgi:uncharacterized protein (TIGR02611 family)
MRQREQLRGLRHRIRATRTGRITLQVVVATIGVAVVALGVVLIPFPGPGWLIVLAGLAILAVEFVWARRLLAFTRAKLEKWWHWLGRQHWSVRILAGLAGVAFVSGVVWLALRYSLGVKSISDVWTYITTH